MNQRGIVIYANAWSFIDDKSGETKEGITIEYLMSDSMKPVRNEDGSRGFKLCKQSVSLDRIDSIKEVPGVYDMSFVLKSVRGKPELKLDGLTFVSSVK